MTLLFLLLAPLPVLLLLQIKHTLLLPGSQSQVINCKVPPALLLLLNVYCCRISRRRHC